MSKIGADDVFVYTGSYSSVYTFCYIKYNFVSTARKFSLRSQYRTSFAMYEDFTLQKMLTRNKKVAVV